MYQLWMESGNPAYSHGSLAFLISFYIFGTFWFSKTSNITFKLNYIGVVFVLLASMGWLLATLGNIQVLQQLFLAGLVGLLFWSLFGFSVYSKLILPTLIIFTAIPIWDFMNIYLQHITAVGVSFLLGFTTIPFVKEGVNILLQSDTFEIADRCSGLRMVTAMMAIALLYLHQWRVRWQVGIAFLVAAILVAILANVVRILIVVIAGHLTEMKHYFVTTDHIMLGWVVFGIIMMGFLYLSNKILLSKKYYSRATVINEPANLTDVNNKSAKLDIKTIGIIAIVGMVTAVGPVMAKISIGQYESQYINSADISVALARSYHEWKRTKNTQGGWHPKYHGHDVEIQSQYQKIGQGRVDLYLAYYFFQSQGKEAIHFDNVPYESGKWKKLSQRRRTVNVPNVGVFHVTEYKIRSLTGQKKLLWQWYWVGGNRTNSALKAKALGVLGKVTGNPATSVIILATDLGNNDDETAVASLTSFLSEAILSVESTLTLVAG